MPTPGQGDHRMRVLKTIVIILLAVIGIAVLLGFIGPDTYRYERSVTIGAPADVVYPHVSSFAAMDKWSPWNEYDPNMKKSVEGNDGEVGAISRWEGNEDVGKGEQRLDSLVPGSLVRTRLKFLEPWTSECDAMFELTPDGEGTKITWAMVGENNFASKLMGKFMDMDAMIGKDFDKGLGTLKALVEADAAAKAAELAAKTSGGFVIETIERPETIYIGKRNKKVKWQDMGAFFASSFPAAGKAAGEARLEMVGAPSGVYFEWNEKDQTADLLAGMPVKAAADLKVPGMETVVVPASKVLHIPYYGAYEKVGAAHEAMDAYIKANNLTHYANVIEEYVTDPMTEKDTTKWLTNVYYLVK